MGLGSRGPLLCLDLPSSSVGTEVICMLFFLFCICLFSARNVGGCTDTLMKSASYRPVLKK